MPPGQAEAKIGLGADDPHLVGGVEAVGDPAHLRAEGLPVDQDRAPVEVLELCERQAGVLGERGRGEVEPDPRLLSAEDLHHVRPGRLAAEGQQPGGDVDAAARIVGRLDDHVAVHVVVLVRLDRGQLPDLLDIGLEHPGAERRALDPQAEQGVGAAAADLAANLLEQRPRGGVSHDEHLPVRLDVDAALDEQRCEAFDTRVDHGRRSLRGVPWVTT
jgi:hypothetical protein